MKSKSIVRYINVINILVFFCWNYGNSEPEFMFNNFLVSWVGLMEGRVWTLITSVFSHNILLHLLMNTLVLMSFGPVIEARLGTRRFLYFYLAAGAFSSFCHAFVSSFLLHDPSIPALGASGAIFGLFGAWFVLSRRLRLDSRSIVFLIVLNLAISFAVPSIAWQDHLGGLITGAALTAAYAYAPRQHRALVQLGATLIVVAVLVVAVITRDSQLAAAGFG